MKYIIKSLCTYEIEAPSHEAALKLYNQGLWDQNDLTDESAIELGYFTDDHDYHTLQEEADE